MKNKLINLSRAEAQRTQSSDTIHPAFPLRTNLWFDCASARLILKKLFLNIRILFRITKNKLIFLLCFFITSYAWAQQPLLISPDEAVEMAVRKNLALESAGVAANTKKRASDLSWNQFVPSVTVNGSFILNNEKETISGMAAVPIPGMDPLHGVVPYTVDGPRWNIAVPIQASLTISTAMFENINRLKLDYEGGLIAYDKAKLQLERDIRKSYNNMLLLQENILLLRENFEAAERRVELARANYTTGRASELTYLQAQVAMENMKPMLDQAENGYRLSMANFAMFLGLPYDTVFELMPLENTQGFVSLDVQELISQAASDKPDIKELQQNILMLQSARKVQINSQLPYLNLNWGMTPVFISDPVNDWKRSGSLTVTLGVKLHSLFPFSQDFQGIKNMNDQITSANIALARMIQGTEIEIYNTVLSLEKTRTTAVAQEQTIRLAERAYQLAGQSFQAGMQDLLQVQNAELELRQAKLQLLEQQFNYLNGLLDLEYSIGVPFGTLSGENS